MSDAGASMGLPDTLVPIIVTVLTAIAAVFTAAAKIPGLRKGLGRISQEADVGGQSEKAFRLRIDQLERENRDMRDAAMEMRQTLRDVQRLLQAIREKAIRSEERQRSDTERIGRLEDDLDTLSDRFNRRFDGLGDTALNRIGKSHHGSRHNKDADDDGDDLEGSKGGPLSGFGGIT